MRINDISKIQAAEKQLITAIELFFKGADPVSIHTLVWASHEIIQTLAQNKGIKTMKSDALKIIKEDKKKGFIRAMNRPANFFKHADKDPQGSLEFNPEFTEIILWDSVRTFYFLTKRKIPLFIAYDIWAYLKYPKFIKLKNEEARIRKEIIGDITHENKDFFLDWVNEYDSLIKRNVKPDDTFLKFANKDFGPQNTFFSIDTKVWSAIYPLNEQYITKPSEELIFNFFLNEQWSTKITKEKVLYNFLNSTKLIIGEPFIAPDNITKEPAYCVISYSIAHGYGYVNIMKICSIKDSVFSFTYSKKIIGIGDTLLNNIHYWLDKDSKSNTSVINNLSDIGIDSSWITYLNSNYKL